MKNWDGDQRLDILKTSFTEVHSVRRESEQLENRVGTALITGLVVLSILQLKGDVIIPAENLKIFDLAIVLFSAFGSWVLHRNRMRIKSCCRILVRIELGMDLYRPNAYFSDNEIDGIPAEPLYGKAVYPEHAKSWGIGEFRLNSLSYIVGIFIAAVLVISSAHLIAPSENPSNKKMQPTAESVG